MLTAAQDIMGMPMTVTVVDKAVQQNDLDAVFAYFRSVDEQFSPFKPTSEISRMNAGALVPDQYSEGLQTVLLLAEKTKNETHGYFNVFHNTSCDPSGLVKGWAIQNAAQLFCKKGLRNFFLEAGGDIAAQGFNAEGKPWRIGIRNPFAPVEIMKVITASHVGVATSGTYLRGQHIYNPHVPDKPITDIVSLTVIGPTVYDADRFATAAFAMGENGIQFLEHLPGYAAYMVDAHGRATMTTSFDRFIIQA